MYNDTTLKGVPTQALTAARTGRRPPGYRLPDATRLGRVRLAVSNLERAVEFYSGVIGLAVLKAATGNSRLARLGAARDSRPGKQSGNQDEGRILLELEELPGVQPLGKRTRLGLYHTAILLPTREALSSFVLHLVDHCVPFGSADHGVSEALYLTDPDGLTVEVYADRPRAAWQVIDGQIQGGRDPLRFDELPVVAKDSWHGAPPGTAVGHVHFYADDLKKAAGFYFAGQGLDDQILPLPTAIFLSAGGYHHHVGLNVWAAGSPIASAQDARLLFWELALPDATEIDLVAESMRTQGFEETTTVRGSRGFTDALGITVALVVAES